MNQINTEEIGKILTKRLKDHIDQCHQQHKVAMVALEVYETLIKSIDLGDNYGIDYVGFPKLVFTIQDLSGDCHNSLIIVDASDNKISLVVGNKVNNICLNDDFILNISRAIYYVKNARTKMTFEGPTLPYNERGGLF